MGWRDLEKISQFGQRQTNQLVTRPRLFFRPDFVSVPSISSISSLVVILKVMKTLRLISPAINPVIDASIGFVGDMNVLATNSLPAPTVTPTPPISLGFVCYG
jgi:hypothetical protein